MSIAQFYIFVLHFNTILGMLPNYFSLLAYCCSLWNSDKSRNTIVYLVTENLFDNWLV